MKKGMHWGCSGVLQAAIGLLFSTSVLAITPGTITTFAGTGTQGYSGDGSSAASAQLSFPGPVAVDSSGNLYIADSIQPAIRKVSPSGVITTVAGNGQAGYAGDGGAATSAKLGLFITSLAVDSNGNILIGDTFNNVIRKVDTNGIITTIAGTGVHGYTGDGGAATSAQLGNIFGLALDSVGNLYLADEAYHVIRKIDTSGVVTTFAGTGTDGDTGDGGQASSANLGQIYGMTFDASGNLYVADAEFNVVRKIRTDGVISTVAGGGAGGDGSLATAASMAITYDVAFDGAGNLYILTGNVVREVNTSGVISTFAGNGTAGYTGDNGPATSAEFNNPFGLAIDAAGDVYVGDMQNNVVRRIQGPLTATSNIFDAAGTLAYTTAVAYNPGLTPAAATSGVVPNQLAVGSSNIGVADNGVLVVLADPGAQTVDLSSAAPSNMLFSLPAGITIPLQYGNQQIQATGSAGVGSTNIPVVLATGVSGSLATTTGLTLLAGEVQLGVQSAGSIGSMLWGQGQNQRAASITTPGAATADMVRYADGSGALAALNGSLTVQISASSTQAAQTITLLAGEVAKFDAAGQITGTYLGSATGQFKQTGDQITTTAPAGVLYYPHYTTQFDGGNTLGRTGSTLTQWMQTAVLPGTTVSQRADGVLQVNGSQASYRAMISGPIVVNMGVADGMTENADGSLTISKGGLQMTLLPAMDALADLASYESKSGNITAIVNNLVVVSNADYSAQSVYRPHFEMSTAVAGAAAGLSKASVPSQGIVYTSSSAVTQRLSTAFINEDLLAAAAKSEGWTVSFAGVDGAVVAVAPNGQQFSLVPGQLVALSGQQLSQPFGVTSAGQLYFYSVVDSGAGTWGEAQLFSLQ